MRRLPPWFWLVLALIFGTTATFMALGWLRGQSRKQAANVALKPVVVAAKDIGPAVALSKEQLVVRRWPRESCPRGSFSKVEEVAGRVTAYPFGAGEPILEVKLAPPGMPPGLTALVAPEKRAMTVKVDEASGVAGFLAPGNRVDVVATVDRGAFKDDPIAKVILQNLRVLGTGQKIERRPGEKPQVVPTVTLEVTPEEGERLALAMREGRISLVLRGQQDQQLVYTGGVRTASLLQGAYPLMANGEQDQKKTPTGPPPQQVEVIKGLQRESVSLPHPRPLPEPMNLSRR
ncbi:MAG: Flp pilus assembly protein CpaB [Deltaproteobacteria bacterium]|nr:Flp pilus assembly protein CpaB [Deltaproteobacteria bacterium]